MARRLKLHCHAEGREAKETAMVARFGKLFEEGLQKISEGLQKPRSQRRAHKLLERMGRLKQKSRRAGQHYTVNLAVDESGKTAMRVDLGEKAC